MTCGNPEMELPHLLGVPVVGIFVDFGVVLLSGVGGGVKHVVVAGDAAAVLGWAVPFAADVV